MSSSCYAMPLSQKTHLLKAGDRTLQLMQYLFYLAESGVIAGFTGYYLKNIETNDICTADGQNISD